MERFGEARIADHEGGRAGGPQEEPPTPFQNPARLIQIPFPPRLSVQESPRYACDAARLMPDLKHTREPHHPPALVFG